LIDSLATMEGFWL